MSTNSQRIIRQASVISIDDSSDFRTGIVEVMGKESRAIIHGTYGFAYNPPAGSTGTLIASAGGDATKYFFPDQAPNRPQNLSPGEVQTGNYNEGNSIKYDAEGNITVMTAGTRLFVSRNGDIEIEPSGNVVIRNADIIVEDGDVVADGISLKTHIHGGVATGGSTTDIPQQ